jgi:four helix bundle protein
MASGEVANGKTNPVPEDSKHTARAFQSYRDLEVWQVGVDIAVACYELTRSFPPDERFGLISQIRRAATSIPANIAEGHGRASTQDFIRFCRFAQGSLKEVETHLIVATRVEAVCPTDVESLLTDTDRLGRMLRGLIRSLEARRR